MQGQLAVEMGKQVTLTAPQVRAFLYALKCGDIDDENTRRGIINIFLRAIYLYDDRMTLIFNGGERPIILDDVLLDEIEKHFESAGSYHEKCSPLVADAPPRRSKVRFAPTSFYARDKKDVIRLLPCSSFPTATRCAGLAVGGLPCGRDFSRLRNVDFNHPFQMNITRTPAFSKAALREGCGCDVNNRKKGCQWYNYHWRLSFFDILL